ncbi:MAG: hypothetical protein P8Z35_14040 [Ignavibacteriaceae bacterium]|jgi:type II secretory pathway component PulJ
MGFSTIIDILGSIIIGGILLLILWRLDDSATQSMINNGQDVALQQNLTTIANVLEYDFRKIGYCANLTQIQDSAITQADSNSITFLSDEKNAGVLNQIHYYLGPTSELSSTPNPDDRYLHREIDGSTTDATNLDVIDFKLVYYDDLGQKINSPVSDPSTIASIEINILIEDPFAYDNQYSQAFWKQIRVVSKNLHKR